jgi:hypothetical protein
MENAPGRVAPGAISFPPGALRRGIFFPQALRAGGTTAHYFAGAGSLRAMSHCTCTSFSMGFTAGS